MDIRIYQVNTKRDPNNVCFMAHDSLERFQGSAEIDSKIYDKVFEGNVDCKTLESIYTMFNTNHPQGYKARSLSVSDVVEIVNADTGKSSFHFCDSFGFKEVNFNPDECQLGKYFSESQKENTISVLLVQQNKHPKMIEIEPTLEAMQKVVGGSIEEYMPFEDEVSIVCNEEGKMNGLPLNRAVYIEQPETDMSYLEMKKRFREAENNRSGHLTGYIVFSQDSFTKPYSLESRTYVVSSDNKAFQPNMGGYSIFASALDGTDMGVRLEQYMAEERGGKDGWKVERCYMKEHSREIIDIIAGDFFIAYAPIESEKYESLPKALADKYMEIFKQPERFLKTENGITVVPFKPVKADRER